MHRGTIHPGLISWVELMKWVVMSSFKEENNKSAWLCRYTILYEVEKIAKTEKNLAKKTKNKHKKRGTTIRVFSAPWTASDESP